MPTYDDTTVAQTIPRSTPRPHSVDRNRDYYAHDDRSAETIFVEKRHYSRLNHSPKENLAIRQDEYIRKPRQQSRSVNLPKRQVTFNEDTYSSDDSDSEYKRSRALSRPKSDRRLRVIPSNDKPNGCPQNANPRFKTRTHDNDSDSGYSSVNEDEKQIKQRNKKLVYTGLACITTAAAANNIYQNTKAHYARRNQVREGESRMLEAQRSKNKALLMDVFTLGVAAVGINNARMCWKKVDAIERERE